MLVEPQITYMFLVPDWRAHEVTPFQGFAPGLLDHLAGFQGLVKFPGDVYEYAMPRADRLARRAGGVGGWRWIPFNASQLPQLTIPTSAPLWVMFSAEPKVTAVTSTWIRDQPIRPLHVSSH